MKKKTSSNPKAANGIKSGVMRLVAERDLEAQNLI